MAGQMEPDKRNTAPKKRPITNASTKITLGPWMAANMSSLVLGAVFIDAIKRALRDNDADWDAFVDRWQRNSGASMYDALDRFGILGSLFTASNSFGKLSNGQFSLRGGMACLSGDADRTEARKVRDIGLGGALLGPAAGMAEDVVKTVQAGARYADGGTITRSDLRRFQHLLPYNSVPGIQSALNAISDFSASAMGAPPEPKHHH